MSIEELNKFIVQNYYVAPRVVYLYNCLIWVKKIYEMLCFSIGCNIHFFIL